MNYDIVLHTYLRNLIRECSLALSEYVHISVQWAEEIQQEQLYSIFGLLYQHQNKKVVVIRSALISEVHRKKKNNPGVIKH